MVFAAWAVLAIFCYKSGSSRFYREDYLLEASFFILMRPNSGG